MQVRGRDEAVVRVEGKVRWSETGRCGGVRPGQGKHNMVDITRGDVRGGGKLRVGVAGGQTDKGIREYDVVGGRRRQRRRAWCNALLRVRNGIPFKSHGGVAAVCGGC